MVTGHGQTMLTWSCPDAVLTPSIKNFLTKKCLKTSARDLSYCLFVFLS